MSTGKIYFTFFLLLTIVSVKSPAQTALSFRNITINQGLSQNSVVSIAVDKTGFLWCATQDGLNRYDGNQFVVFSKIFDDVTKPSGNQLGKVVVGNNNDLWLITSGGKLERFNLYDHSFTAFGNFSGSKKDLPPVSCLLSDEKENELWIGTDKDGLIRYTSGMNDPVYYRAGTSASAITDNHIQSIFKDRQNNHWLLTANGLTFFATNTNQTKKILNVPDAGSPAAISFSAMEQDDEDALWLGSFGKGLYVKKQGDSSFIPFYGFSTAQSLPADLVVHTIKTDNDGRIWVGSYGRGLFLIDKQNRTIQNFTFDKKKSSSLGYNDVLCIETDDRGGLWIGTDGGGLSYYHTGLNNFAVYSALNLPDNISVEQVRSVTTDRSGKLWIGTSNQGLVFIDPADSIFQKIQLPADQQGIDIPERIVSLYCDEDNDIWVGTQGNGLIIVDATTKKVKDWFYPFGNRNKQLPDRTLWCMLPLQDGNVIGGTQHAGLFLINKRAGTVQNFNPLITTGNTANFNNVRTLTRINDSLICIGYERNGLRLMNTSTRIATTLSDARKYPLWKDEIIIKSVYYRAPFVLTGTLGRGLIIHDLSSGKQSVITEELGLPNNTIYGILEDRQGLLWLSSNKGLSRFRMPANPAIVNRSHFTSFSAADGLQSNEFNTGAYYADNDGSLYFGGIKGLNVFNPLRFTNTSHDIPVVITSATINNQPIMGDTVISFKKILNLKYNENSLSFNFAALEFLSNARLNYSYRLLGYDNNWIEAGNRNYVAYTNLEPGHYTLEIRASDQSVKTNTRITQMVINIAPPYWRTWWFIALCVALVLSLLYAIYRYRVNQLLEMQQVRSRIATDLHDDIGSTLTNINILSELSKKNLDRRPEAEVFLNRITEEVNVSNQALDDIVWSINKNNDNIEQTVARMRRYAAEVLEGANIKYSLNADEEMPQRKLNMELRRDFYLLFKESLNNVYKHSKAKNVEIKVWMEKNHLQLLIRDDGIGFERNNSTHRNGIKNMHTRTAKWQGVIRITTAPGKGTSTEVSLPVS